MDGDEIIIHPQSDGTSLLLYYGADNGKAHLYFSGSINAPYLRITEYRDEKRDPTCYEVESFDEDFKKTTHFTVKNVIIADTGVNPRYYTSIFDNGTRIVKTDWNPKE